MRAKPSRSTPLVPAAPAMASAAFRELAHAAVDLIANHLDGTANIPVFAPITPADRASLLERPLPQDGVDPHALLALVDREIFTHPMGNGHPRFFGWINSPPTPVGVV